MIRRARTLVAAFAASLAGLTTLLASARARADEIDEGEPFRSIAIELNPLGFAIGRYTMDLEYLPAPHHAIHLTPVGYYALPGNADTFQGFGAEGGYRFYAGANGPEGFFAGASGILGGYEYVHTTSNPSPLDVANDTQFVALGGALDVGFQWVGLGNFAIGGGIGVQYTAYTSQPRFEYASHPWEDLFFGAGVRPRVLLSVGTAF